MNKQGNVASRLWQHKQRGREIRIPGGKSMYEDHASFGIIYRDEGFGLEILVIPYDPKKQKLVIKEDTFPEDSRGTLVRELLEETMVKARQFTLIGTFPIQDNRLGREEYNHIKYVYAVDQYDASEIRTAPSSSERIFAPFWVPIEMLREEIWKHHKWMIDFFEEYYQCPKIYKPKEFSIPQYAAA